MAEPVQLTPQDRIRHEHRREGQDHVDEDVDRAAQGYGRTA